MEEGHGLGHLLEDPPCRCLSNDPIGHRLRVLLKRDALDVVGDDVYLLRCIDQVMQLDYTGVL